MPGLVLISGLAATGSASGTFGSLKWPLHSPLYSQASGRQRAARSQCLDPNGGSLFQDSRSTPRCRRSRSCPTWSIRGSSWPQRAASTPCSRPISRCSVAVGPGRPRNRVRGVWLYLVTPEQRHSGQAGGSSPMLSGSISRTMPQQPKTSCAFYKRPE
jgi:hypothetical protein